jgi:hypothetical protein
VCAEERGAPPKADRAAVLSRVLDLPRLLDLCSLYSAPAADSSSGSSSSSSLLARVVDAAFGLLPQLSSQAAQAAPLLAQNLGQVAEACLTAAASASRDSGMMQSLQGVGHGMLSLPVMLLVGLLGALSSPCMHLPMHLWTWMPCNQLEVDCLPPLQNLIVAMPVSFYCHDSFQLYSAAACCTVLQMGCRTCETHASPWPASCKPTLPWRRCFCGMAHCWLKLSALCTISCCLQCTVWPVLGPAVAAAVGA